MTAAAVTSAAVVAAGVIALAMFVVVMAASYIRIVSEVSCKICFNSSVTQTAYTAEQLYAVALADKKRAGGTITLAVPFGIADSRLVTIPVDALEGYIRVGLTGE